MTIFPFFGIFTLFTLFISDASQAHVCLSRSSSLNNLSAYPLPLAMPILFRIVAAQSITKHRFLCGCLSPGWLCFQIISIVVQELRQNKNSADREMAWGLAAASLPRTLQQLQETFWTHLWSGLFTFSSKLLPDVSLSIRKYKSLR